VATLSDVGYGVRRIVAVAAMRTALRRDVTAGRSRFGMRARSTRHLLCSISAIGRHAASGCSLDDALVRSGVVGVPSRESQPSQGGARGTPAPGMLQRHRPRSGLRELRLRSSTANH